MRVGRIISALAFANLVSLSALGDEPADRNRICVLGFSETIRPPDSVTNVIKRTMMREQGIPLSDIDDYELDHVCPLELDCPPLELSNLQLQLLPAAYKKNGRERAVQRAYCAGKLTLPQARGMFSRDPE